jgi:probable rRNA maturation factor
MITFDPDQEEVPLSDRFTEEKLSRIAHAAHLHLPKNIEGVVTLSFISDEEMRRLNRMYREKDKTTDVLSFPSADAELSGYLGDVLISYEQAKRQAEGDLPLELTDLLVHGILHVLHYDHERPEDAEIMFPLQDAIVRDSL